jgi:DNA polymerase/3'-5' exonuclease PolX
MFDSSEFIVILNKLVTLRTKEESLLRSLNKVKEANQIPFRLKNYKKWITIIKKNGNQIKTIADVETFDCSDKLKKKISEFIEFGIIIDIKKTEKTLKELNKELINSSNSSNSSGDITIHINPSPTNEAFDNILNIESNKSSNTNTTEPKFKKKKTRGDTRPTGGDELVIFDLQRIMGIGPSNAKKLLGLGANLKILIDEWDKFINLEPSFKITTAKNIREQSQFQSKLEGIIRNNTNYLKELTYHQLIGIKYFEHIEKRIPRDEIKNMEKLIKSVVSKIDSPKMNVEICGSYRRGNITSGDIDMLLTHSDYKTEEDINKFRVNPLMEFIRILTQIHFIKDHITINGDTKYMGMCALGDSPYARRIDIKFVPTYCYINTLLYFTGSFNFNIKMRNHAKSKGYKLNEYGIENLKTKEIKTSFETEEELFKYIDYPYLTPLQRDI